MLPGNVDVLVDQAIASLRRAMGVPEDEGRGAPLAILIDPALTDPEDALALEGGETGSRIPLRLDVMEPAKCPYLLSLFSNASERVLNAALRLSIEESFGLHDTGATSPRTICAWLVPQRGREPHWPAVAAALVKRAYVRPPGSSGRTIFRFWDPRIASFILKTQPAESRRSLMDAVHVRGWFTILSEGELTDIGPAAGSFGGQRGEGDIDAGWSFGPRDWHELVCWGHANRVEQLMGGWDVSGARPAHQKILSIVRVALQLRFSDEDDVLQFAHRALTVHPSFYMFPPLAQVLADASQHGARLRNVFASVDERIWRQAKVQPQPHTV